ncbi:hypothetical protein L6R53_26760 [Myxococcota bacterium]|nr:hypothetical protein [Myxococcota bacterium]
MRAPRLCMSLWIPWALGGCRGRSADRLPAPEPAPTVEAPAPRAPDTGLAVGWEGAPTHWEVGSPHPLQVLDPGAFPLRVEAEAPSYACDGGLARVDRCDEDYRALAAQRFGGDAAALERCVEATVDRWVALRREVDEAGTRPQRAIDDPGLRQQLTRRLRLGELQSDAPVWVRAGPVEDRGDHRQVDLVVEDPLLGPFPARLLLPALPVEAPGLLMLPGHLAEGGRELDEMSDRLRGRELAAEGRAVLIVGFRAYDAGLAEYQAGLELACGGLSLAAVRMREVGVALDLLRGLAPGADVGEQVGVLGHSGGAVWAVLAAALQPLDAVVLDATSRQFLGVERSTDGASVQVLDETVPALVDLFDCVYTLGVPVPLEGISCDRPPTPTPHLFVPYGYRDAEMGTVRRFLAEHLPAGQPGGGTRGPP